MEDKLKFKIERFNGEKKFTLWNERVNDILVDRDFMKALLAKTMKPPEISGRLDGDPRKDGENHKKCLVDEVMYNM